MSNSATPWTVACQAYRPREFSRQKKNGVGCHYSRESSKTRIEPTSLLSPATAGRFFTTSATCARPLNLKLYFPWPSTSKPVRHGLHKLIVNHLLFGILFYPWTLSCKWDNVLWFKCTYVSRCFSYSLKFGLWKSIMVPISDTTTWLICPYIHLSGRVNS